MAEGKSKLTEVVFILDRSGSMEGLEKDTIGGFNSMLKKQKSEPGRVLVSTVLFDDACQVLHDRVPLENVRPMTEEDYWTRGCTALLDAVGGAIDHIGRIHKYARAEDLPDKTLFVITTDGMENASGRYSYRDVSRMVKRQEERYGWEFIFLGANIDAEKEAARYGIRKKNAVNYVSEAVGTGLNFAVMCEAISEMRTCKEKSLSSNWRKKVDSDYKKRHR